MKTRFVRLCPRALLLACVATIACTTTSEPRYSREIVAIQPPAVYAYWWQLTETCAGLTGSMSRVNWYELPDADSVEVEGSYASGFWLPWSNTIVLAGNHDMEGPLVRHEMLHALIHGGHERDYFIDRCAGVVSCSEFCAEDAGGPPYPEKPASTGARRIAVPRVAAARSPLRADSGWLAIGLRVRCGP